MIIIPQIHLCLILALNFLVGNQRNLKLKLSSSAHLHLTAGDDKNDILKSVEALALSCGDDVRGIVRSESYDCPETSSMMNEGNDDGEVISNDNPLLPGAAEIIGEAFRKWLVLEKSRSSNNAITENDRDDDEDMIIAVGRDPRLSSPAIASAFQKGCIGYDAGLTTTPSMLEWLLREDNEVETSNKKSSGRSRNLGAVMITASHLPWKWNGLKFFSAALKRGLNKREVQKLMEIAVEIAKNNKDAPKAVTATDADDVASNTKVMKNFMDPYIEKLKHTIIREASSVLPPNDIHNSNSEHVPQPLKGMSICVNAGNGNGGFFATRVLEPLGAECIAHSINLNPDGTFPNHPSNPEDKQHEEATITAMIANGPGLVDVGVMLDTDVDRCGLVDGTTIRSSLSESRRPEPVNKNRLVALCAKVALESSSSSSSAKKSTGTVVTDALTSSGVTKYIAEELHGTHDRYKVGYRNVIDRADSNPDAVLAIEISGHSAWRDNNFVDDGCYTAAKLLGRLARERQKAERDHEKNLNGKPFGLLDLLGGKLEEPKESIKVRMNVIGGLSEVPPAYEQLKETLLQCCHDNKSNWILEKINHDGLRCAVTIPKTIYDDNDATDVDDINSRSVNNEAWLIVRSSLHEPVVSIQTESNVFGGIAYICSTMFQTVTNPGQNNDGIKFDLEPLQKAGSSSFR